MGAARWLEVIADWVEHSSSLHVIFYEELAAEPEPEIRQLLQHLGLQEDRGRLGCIQQHSTGSFHR